MRSAIVDAYQNKPVNPFSPFAISCHKLDNLACTAGYNPTMFSILESSSNELHFSILETFLVTSFQPELCIRKQFYTLLLFSNNFVPTPTLLANHNFFLPCPCSLVDTIQNLNSSNITDKIL